MSTETFRIIGALLLIYFLPALSAVARQNRDTHKILLINLYTGWTVVGWITAMRWAWDPNLKRHRQITSNDRTTRLAPGPNLMKTWRQDIRHPY